MSTADLRERVRRLPGMERLLKALVGLPPTYLVGGWVRDLLRGELPDRGPDLVVEGDAPLVARALADRLGGEVREYERFRTAIVRIGDVEVDLVTSRKETYDAPDFDPATYLVAIEQASGRYAGLVRVWNRPGGPRLGLIGVGRLYRRRGLARSLLAQAFGVLHDRGKAEVVAEVDVTNTGSNRLLGGLGAWRIGGFIEMIRPWPGGTA